MKKSLFLAALLLVAMSGFAATSINNFTGFNDYWHPYGDGSDSTQTYGELFTAPTNGDNNLTSFSFYTATRLTAETSSPALTSRPGQAATLVRCCSPAPRLPTTTTVTKRFPSTRVAWH